MLFGLQETFDDLDVVFQTPDDCPFPEGKEAEIDLDRIREDYDDEEY